MQNGAEFAARAVVTKDGSDEIAEASSPNPSNILGIAAEASYDSLFPEALVYVTSESFIFGFYGDRDSQTSDIGEEYGLRKSTGGAWVVDTTETSATRLKVRGVIPDRGVFLCTILADYQQN